MTSFLSRLITLIFLAAILGLLVVDITDHGSFEASKTGVFLEKSGALRYGGIAWSNFITYSQQAYRWSQKNVPVYISNIREFAAPYLHTLSTWIFTLVQNLCSNIELLYKYFLEKKPLFEQWFNQYAPGMIEIASSCLKQAWEYSVLLVDLLLQYISVAVQWLMDNVFIGSLSPENLQRYTMEALNSIQQLGLTTLSWLNNKLHAAAAIDDSLLAQQ